MGYLAAYAAEKRYDPTASPDGAWSDDERARGILVLLEEEALEGEYRSKADTFARAPASYAATSRAHHRGFGRRRRGTG